MISRRRQSRIIYGSRLGSIRGTFVSRSGPAGQLLPMDSVWPVADLPLHFFEESWSGNGIVALGGECEAPAFTASVPEGDAAEAEIID